MNAKYQWKKWKYVKLSMSLERCQTFNEKNGNERKILKPLSRKMAKAINRDLIDKHSHI